MYYGVSGSYFSNSRFGAELRVRQKVVEVSPTSILYPDLTFPIRTGTRKFLPLSLTDGSIACKF
jgi:hypothetical protein